MLPKARKRVLRDAFSSVTQQNELVTIDTKHDYVHHGLAFSSDYVDTIAAGNTFYFLGKNTSTDKEVHVQMPHFNKGDFVIQFIKNATLTNPQRTVELPVTNVNLGSPNVNSFKIWPQSTQAPQSFSASGGTVIASEAYEPVNEPEIQYVIPPGMELMATFKSDAASGSQKWHLRLFWFEVPVRSDAD